MSFALLTRPHCLAREAFSLRLRSVFDRFRAIAHEGEVDKRVQFTIEELYRVRARGFEAEGFASVLPALDLVHHSSPPKRDAAGGTSEPAELLSCCFDERTAVSNSLIGRFLHI